MSDEGPRRAVSGPDEDTTTMGAEAARWALRGTAPPATSETGAPAPGAPVSGAWAPGDPGTRGPTIDNLWFATATPAYLDKTNATAIHAALRLGEEAGAFDCGGGLRSGIGALRLALAGTGTALVVAADQRDGLPGSNDETAAGDAAAAVVVADDRPGTPVLAEVVAIGTATDEFVDRWRSPGERRSRTWEERFGETRYVPLARRAAARALAAADLGGHGVDRMVVTGMHARATRSATAAIARDGTIPPDRLAGDRAGAIGRPGTAQPLLALVDLLEQAAADGAVGRTLLVVHLADGADAMVVRTTAALGQWRPLRPVGAQVAAGVPLAYGRFLAWRGMLTPEPPRRPPPPRVSAPAAARNESWKFGFVGSRSGSSGSVHLPPARLAMDGGALDDMEPVAMADATGRIVTFTVDTMVHSPDPPVVFAVVDFDGGGRFPVELTDVDADAVAIGTPVELTFRRLSSADGIHDYFWKARPLTPPDGTTRDEATDEHATPDGTTRDGATDEHATGQQAGGEGTDGLARHP